MIRSATKMTAELIEKADSLRAIGRAGTGVDNVDMEAATKRGIIVANAPESNSVAAAEHTLALALASFRNVAQAHRALVGGEWARSRYGGNELYGKTLGILGFGRIGQLVARRALAFDMNVVAFDKFVSAERFRELGVEGAETSEELYARADLITIHLPKTPETINWIDDEAIEQMKDGVRIVNCARGELIDLEALERGARVGQGRRRRARRLPRRADHRAPALRPRRRRRHPAPRSLDRRGPGPGRDRHRRAGRRRADRRRRHQRGQHPGRPAGDDGGARAVRAALREARPAGDRARQRRGRVGQRRGPRPARRARDPAALDRHPGRHLQRSHRGAGQPGQRPEPRCRARDRGLRDHRPPLRGLHRADHRASRVAAARRSRSPAPASARATIPIWSPPGVRASTCPSPITWRSSATPTSRG